MSENNSEKKIVGALLGVICGIGAAVIAAPLVIAGVGFTAGGVAAGSLAAAWQSSIGAVAAGSLFASLQSAGAVGLGAAGYAAAAAAGAAAGGTIGAVAGKSTIKNKILDSKFKKYSNGADYITFEDLVQICKELGIEVTHENLRNSYKKITGNDKLGRITYEEFMLINSTIKKEILDSKYKKYSNRADYITFEDLIQICKELGIEVIHKNLRNIYKKITGNDKLGRITYEEFMRINSTIKKEILDSKFKTYSNGADYITFEDLVQICKELGIEVTHENLRNIYKNKLDRITYEEFMRINSTIKKEILDSKFKKYSNGADYITFEDLVQICKELGIEVTHENLGNIYKKITGNDKLGRITYKEFMRIKKEILDSKFKKYSNRADYIIFEDLVQICKELGIEITQLNLKNIYKKITGNDKLGRITYEEFMRINSTIKKEILDIKFKKYSNGADYITFEDLVQICKELGIEVIHENLRNIYKKITGNDKLGRITYEEFMRINSTIKKEILDSKFKTYSNGADYITFETFEDLVQIFKELGIEVIHENLRNIYKKITGNDKLGRITYEEFMRM